MGRGARQQWARGYKRAAGRSRSGQFFLKHGPRAALRYIGLGRVGVRGRGQAACTNGVGVGWACRRRQDRSFSGGGVGGVVKSDGAVVERQVLLRQCTNFVLNFVVLFAVHSGESKSIEMC